MQNTYSNTYETHANVLPIVRAYLPIIREYLSIAGCVFAYFSWVCMFVNTKGIRRHGRKIYIDIQICKRHICRNVHEKYVNTHVCACARTIDKYAWKMIQI